MLFASAVTAGLAVPGFAARKEVAVETGQVKAKGNKAKGKAKGKPAETQPASKPASRPATQPVDPAKAARRAELVKQATEHLTNWYAKQLDSTDWMARAVALISISRMPAADATARIIEKLGAESHPVCRLVAWQAALARAGMLSDKQHAAWLAATRNMIREGLFHGDLRIGLLEMLGSVPADIGAKACFRDLFAHTSSLDSSDVATLIAMGRCLRSWADAELVETLISSLGSPSSAVRAELILQAAGADVPWNRTPSARKDYQEWWKKSKSAFTATGPQPGAWKKLKPQYLDPPLDPARFDVLDMKWRREMELQQLQLRSFGFGLALDCSRSMRPEIERLKRDMRVMFTAFSLIAREVGVGLTLFAPGGELRHHTLTDDLTKLMASVNATEIFGPPGEEEWAGAIDKAMNTNRWPAIDKDNRRAIVIISDEPITANQFSRAMPLASKGAEKGFRLYGIMVHPLTGAPNNPLAVPLDRTGGGSLYDPNDPRNLPYAAKANKAGAGKQAKAQAGGAKGGWDYYGQLAEATGGRAMTVLVPQGGLGLGTAPDEIDGRASAPKPDNKARQKQPAGKAARNLDPMAIAPIYPGGGPTNSILTVVLTDAIGRAHADRVEPLVKILVAYCQKAAARVPEKRSWQPPAAMEPNLKQP
jgi:hypothetical protein